MKKKGLLITFTVILLVSVGLLITGIVYNANVEAQPRFTGEYHVRKEQLLYVMEASDTETLYYQSDEGEVKELYETEKELKIESPIFTGEKEVSFVLTTGAPDEPPGKQEFQLVHSDVVTVGLEHKDPVIRLDARGYITDLIYDEANNRMLVSGVHMSTEEQPEPGFIPYASTLYSLGNKGELNKIREFDAYSPGSLQLAENGEFLYMILPDDFENVSPESMFQSTERIFKMSLAEPNELEVVSKEDSEVPISEFVLLEEENRILYQTIMNYGDGGRFLYDHIWYEMSESKEGERLYLNEAVMNSKLAGNALYYTKMDRRANNTQVYSLYRYELSGGKAEEKIQLQASAEKTE